MKLFLPSLLIALIGISFVSCDEADANVETVTIDFRLQNVELQSCINTTITYTITTRSGSQNRTINTANETTLRITADSDELIGVRAFDVNTSAELATANIPAEFYDPDFIHTLRTYYTECSVQHKIVWIEN